MTFLPAHQKDIEKAAGPLYDPLLDSFCSNPTCSKRPTERHHIVRKSFLAGAYDWVEIEGTTVGNVVGLCLQCHKDITENKAGIFWLKDDIGNLGFFWQSRDLGENGLLKPHPPTDGTWNPTQVESPHVHREGEPCKRCHGSGQEPRKEAPEWTEEEGDKTRKVFAIRIPKAELSFGYDSLRQLISQAGDSLGELGYDAKTPPYYILAYVLYKYVTETRGDLSESEGETDSPDLSGML